MPPKQLKDASVFSLVTSWMQPKPNTEHSKTDDKTPSPTEVADSSQEAEKPENGQTFSPTELVHSPDMEYYFEQNAAYENEDGDDDDDVATDEADAMAKLVQEVAVKRLREEENATAVKRPREEEKATAVAAPPEEQPEGSGLSCKPYPSRPNFGPKNKLSNCQIVKFARFLLFWL